MIGDDVADDPVSPGGGGGDGDAPGLDALRHPPGARYVQGGADNPRMEAFGPIVLEMMENAAALAQSTSL